MEYFVLAYKGERKTYEMSSSLDDAYFDADTLKGKGWTIYSIFCAEVKEDYVSDYKNIKLAVKNMCKDYKEILNQENNIASIEQIAEIKKDIIDKLERDDIKANDAEYYVEKMVEECLDWNETTYRLVKYMQNQIKSGKVKLR